MTTPATPDFNPSNPLVTDTFANWQICFLANFQRLFLDFNKNHVPLDDVSASGNHTYIELIEQAEKSFQQTGVGEISVYTKDVIGQTDQIFMRHQDGTEFQFSNYQIYPLMETPSQRGFFTFLPGKVICYFGILLNRNQLNK